MNDNVECGHCGGKFARRQLVHHEVEQCPACKGVVSTKESWSWTNHDARTADDIETIASLASTEAELLGLTVEAVRDEEEKGMGAAGLPTLLSRLGEFAIEWLVGSNQHWLAVD